MFLPLISTKSLVKILTPIQKPNYPSNHPRMHFDDSPIRAGWLKVENISFNTCDISHIDFNVLRFGNMKVWI